MRRTRIKFIEPMYARLVNLLPEGKNWLYEVKFDGYRCLAGKDASGVTLWSRRGNLFTADFPSIARACKRLPSETLVDGEVVAVDERGRISFNLLQHRRSKAHDLLFYVFDVLIYRGSILLKEPLTSRRELLSNVVRTPDTSPIRISESFQSNQTDLLKLVREAGFEGIIAKDKDSRYESGKRTGAWSKYKVNQGQEFVIGGYTAGNPFDALIVGYYDGGKLYYVAKVRNGFVPSLRQEVYRRFKGLETATCPFVNLPEKRKNPWALTAEQMKQCQWLKPKLVAQIEFTEWTPDGNLRHSRFAGLREDKAAMEVVREAPA